MAIDNAEKRRSISGIGWLMPGVTPNSAKDQEWRQEAGWSYSGIAAAAASVVVYAQWGMPFYFNSSNWGSDAKFYLEVFFRSVIGEVFARLFDLTSSVAVADSELSTDNTSFRRQRTTTALTLTDTHEYRLQLGKVNTTVQGEEEGADVVVIG